MALAISIFMFSLAGIPPLAGFFAKWYVIVPIVTQGYYTLATIAVLSSVVGAYYYIRIVKLMYFDEPADAFDKPAGREVRAILGVSTLLVTFFILRPDLIVEPAEAAARHPAQTSFEACRTCHR